MRINKNQKTISEKKRRFSEESNRQRQTLEFYINDLEKRNEVQGRSIAQQRLQEKELDGRIQAISNDLISLEKNRERLIDCQQNKYGEAERYESWLEELLNLDQLTIGLVLL